MAKSRSAVLYGYLGQSNAPSSSAGELPDPPGSGALRFTNGQPTAITRRAPSSPPERHFPTNLGVQITFKAVSYRGNSGNGDGADGMAFFYDGRYLKLPPYDVGAFGQAVGAAAGTRTTMVKSGPPTAPSATLTACGAAT